jgi:hypothetical protein
VTAQPPALSAKFIGDFLAVRRRRSEHLSFRHPSRFSRRISAPLTIVPIDCF